MKTLKGYYIAEQFNGKWSLCNEFYCGDPKMEVVLDRALISNLSLKRAKELLAKETNSLNQ